MALLFLWWALMPFILIGLWITLGWFVFSSKSTRLKKIIASVALISFSVFWWFAAGSKLYEEKRIRDLAQNFTITVPANYNGVFTIRFELVDADDLPSTNIVIPANGISVVKFPKRYAMGLSESRTNVVNTNGLTADYMSGTHTSANNNDPLWYFCILQTEKEIKRCFSAIPDPAQYEELILTGKNLNELVPITEEDFE